MQVEYRTDAGAVTVGAVVSGRAGGAGADLSRGLDPGAVRGKLAGGSARRPGASAVHVCQSREYVNVHP